MSRIKIRPEVMQFAEAMERVLRKNDHKIGWEHCTYAELACRLSEERRELAIAMRAPIFVELHRRRLMDREEINPAQAEAIDVANFCMMIWDNLRRERVARNSGKI